MTTATNKATFVSSRKALLDSFSAVERVVPNRAPQAWRQNCRVTVNGTVRLSANDGDQHWTEFPHCQHEGDADVLVPPKKIVALLKKLEHDEVQARITDAKFIIEAGATRFTFSTEDASWEETTKVINQTNNKFDDITTTVSFPDDMAIEPIVEFRMPAQQLIEAWNEVGYACDSTSSRYALGGICVEVTDHHQATFVATDGRRLVISQKEISEVSFDRTVWDNKNDPLKDIAEKHKFVIPKFVFENIKSRKPTGSIRVELCKNHVRLHHDGWTQTSKLIEGRFPRWRDVIPSSDVPVEVDAEKFLKALQSVGLAANDECHGVDLYAQEDALRLHLECIDQEAETTISMQGCGWLSDRLTEKKESGGHEFFMATFDVRYLIDYLKTLNTKKLKSVCLKFTSGIDDGITNCHNYACLIEQHDGPKCVLMPLSRV